VSGPAARAAPCRPKHERERRSPTCSHPPASERVNDDAWYSPSELFEHFYELAPGPRDALTLLWMLKIATSVSSEMEAVLVCR
jgi:hypothetical protein